MRRLPYFPTLLLTLSLLLLTAVVGRAYAQEPLPVEPWPMPQPPPWPEPVPPWPEPIPPWPQPVPPVQFPVAVELHQVDAVIDGPVAEVSVTQVFRNDSAAAIEGVYLFPLPADAAPSSLQMTIDGETVEGKLYDRDEARAIYDEIVRSLRDPALLEWVGRGVFQISVFPIPAGEKRTVELTYEHPVTVDEGLYRFAVPLRAYVPGASPAERVAINVELENQSGLRTIYSPSHAAAIERTGDDGALVGFEGTGQDTQSDFVLYFGTDDSAIGANLLSYKPTGEDGFFLLLVAPSLAAAEEQVIERDIVIVLDVSGSMEGEKIEQARDAVSYVVERLNPGDRFNIVTFSTGVSFWQRSLQEVSEGAREDARADALEWIADIDARGSTDINRALLEGLAQLRRDLDPARPAYLLFMTDGIPTQGETDPQRILDNVLTDDAEGVRLFSFGVGYDVNTDLLDTVSRELGGRSSYVAPEEDIEEVVGDFYSSIGKPVLANVELAIEGDTVVDELYPYPLPDLFAGEQLVVVGRYRDGATVDVEIAGDVNGEPIRFRYPDQVLADAGGESFVARLWATRKVGVLLDQVRRQGADPELIDAIIDLSLEFGIVTPYTSYLVLEPGMEGPVVQSAAEAAAAAPTLRQELYDTGGAALDAAAASPAEGAAAVAASEARTELETASAVREQSSVRVVEGTTFVQRGYVESAGGAAVPFWVDTGYDEAAGAETETVIFGSDRYFELAADDTIARKLSLSAEMILLLEDGSAVRITAAE